MTAPRQGERISTVTSNHPDRVLKQVRDVDRQSFDADGAPLSSWERCLVDHNLAPDRRRAVPRLGHRQINELQDSLGAKLALAQHELDVLYSIVAPSRYSVVLAAADCTLISLRNTAVADDLDVDERSGAIWSEQNGGTNGVGTCLFDGKPTSIHLDQHFFTDHIHSSCANVPLFAPDCTLWGSLGIANVTPGLKAETHALAWETVMASAERMSETIFRNTFRDCSVVRFRFENGRSCLLAIDEDFTVVGADVAARRVLDLKMQALTPFSLWDRFAGRKEPISRVEGDLSAIELRSLDNGAVARGGVLAPLERRTRARVARRPSAVPPTEGQATTMDTWAGSDPGMVRDVGMLRRLLNKRLSIVLLGETGVGKDTLARAFHAESTRRHHPFVAVNCGAIPESLIESELFGYAGGAFTGARKEGASGRFFQADGGTLFLDEIGEMPVALQTRLLRVLESGEIAPLGSGEVRHVDVQVIAATNRDLERHVVEGTFREDLYYRLAGLVVTIPSLRDRADRAAVIDRCVGQIAGRDGIRLTSAARDALQRHTWPGNMRELHTVLNRAAYLAEGGVVEAEDLMLRPLQRSRITTLASAGIPVPVPANAAAEREAERDALLDALRRVGGDVTNLTTDLGVSRATLYRRLKKHGLARRLA